MRDVVLEGLTAINEALKDIRLKGELMPNKLENTITLSAVLIDYLKNQRDFTKPYAETK